MQRLLAQPSVLRHAHRTLQATVALRWFTTIDKRQRLDNILCGQNICISGKLTSTREIIRSSIAHAGGKVCANARGTCTILVTTPTEVAKPTRKVADARVLGIPIVSEDWLAACLHEGELVDTGEYVLDSCNTIHITSEGGPLVNPASRYASSDTLRYMQQLRQALDDDYGVEPRGCLEVDFVVRQTGGLWTTQTDKEVRVTHLKWYSVPYEEWQTPDEDYDGFDPAFPDLPNETFVQVFVDPLTWDQYHDGHLYTDGGFADGLRTEILKLVADGQLPTSYQIRDGPARRSKMVYELKWGEINFTEQGQQGYDPLYMHMILGLW